MTLFTRLGAATLALCLAGSAAANPVPERTGVLRVVKTVVSEGSAAPPSTSFVVDVVCAPYGPNTAVTLTSANGYQAAVQGIPTGSNCTVTERPPVVPADLAKRGCHWETRYPDAEGPVPAKDEVVRRVINRWICKDIPKDRDDLAIRKLGPASVNAGDTVTYSLQVTNLGTQPVAPAGNGAGAIVTDAIPPGFTLVSPQSTNGSGFSGTSNGWVCFAPTLTCGYGGPAVAPGAAFPPLVIELKATSVGGFQQCASIGYIGKTDAVSTNNKSCVGVTIRPRPK